MELGPARWLQNVLRWFLRDDLAEAVEGDLSALYQRRRAKMGRFRASMLYAWNVITFFQPFAWRRLESIHWMFWFRLRLFRRSARQEGFITTAKVLGLAIALVVVLTTMTFTAHHQAYDAFIHHKDQMYRVNLLATFEEIEGTELGTSHYRLGPLIEDIPEVESYTRVFNSQSGYIKSDKKAFFDQAFFADENFFNQFSYQLIHGRSSDALSQPHGVVISEELSHQLFGEANPMGKSLVVKFGSWIVNAEAKESEVFVTGVFKTEDFAHLQFDLVTSFATPNTLDSVKWSGPVVSTYIRSTPGSEESIIEEKLSDFYEVHHESLANMYQPTLQPLNDVHMASAGIDSDPLNDQKFDQKYLSIFQILTWVILLVAAINFIQLTQGIQMRRNKQQAITSWLGGSRHDGLVQHGFETFILLSCATLFSFLLMQLLSPLIYKQWGISLNLLMMAKGTFGLIWLVLLATLVIIPALLVTTPSLDTVSQRSTAGTWTSRILIGSQLIMGISLVAGSIVIYKQTRFMLEQNSIANQQHILQLPMSEDAKANYPAFKNSLLQLTAVESVTAGSNALGSIGGLDMKVKTEGEEKVVILPTLMVDPDYLPFYNINVIEGSDFSVDGKREYIINETLAKQFGWEDPIGQQIGFAFGKPGKVVGVVEDFNYNTLHKKVEAFCFWNTAYYRVISIKIDGSHIPSTLHEIDELWKSHISDAPFSYSFLEEDIEQQYQAELTTNTLIQFLAAIATVLAFIGVYSMTYLMAKQRLREASIKKVLGASAAHLAGSISLPVFGLFILAMIVASPISYVLLNDWIQAFAYRVQLPVEEMIAGFLLLLLSITVAMLANTNRLVKANPVDTLKER